MDKMKCVLNEQQQNIVQDAIVNRTSMAILGSAGTGKSTIINEIIRQCKIKDIKIGVTATTGCAALLIGGTTIHSFMKMGFGKGTPVEIVKDIAFKYKKALKELIELKILIIDEISMLNDELFKKISDILSIIRNNESFFGGVQIILVGDFYQLPPVSGKFCFTSPVWEDMNLKINILSKVYRQEDIHFQSILERAKVGKISKKDMEVLCLCENIEFPEYLKPTRLYSLNVDVSKINNNEYNKLETKEYNYPTYYKNKKSETYANSLKIPSELKLRIGAQVMVCKNIDPENKIVNGTRGVVVSMTNNYIMIKLQNNTEYRIVKTQITSRDDDTIMIEYIPLILAWAITIHKSQGLTLDCAEIDLGESVFQSGQAYTALSRVKDLKSVRIVNISIKAFKIAHPDIIEFYQKVTTL